MGATQTATWQSVAVLATVTPLAAAAMAPAMILATADVTLTVLEYAAVDLPRGWAAIPAVTLEAGTVASLSVAHPRSTRSGMLTSYERDRIAES